MFSKKVADNHLDSTPLNMFFKSMTSGNKQLDFHFLFSAVQSIFEGCVGGCVLPFCNVLIIHSN